MKLAKSIFASIAMSSAAFAAAPASTVAPATTTATCQTCTSTCGCEQPDYAGIAKNKFVESVRPTPPPLPGEPTGFWLEVGAFGGLASQDISGAYPRQSSTTTGGSFNLFEHLDNPGVGKINIVGAEITGGYDITDLVAITFNVGYGYGSASNVGLVSGDLPYRERASVHTFTFMPGLRFSHDLSPQWTLYAGLAAGIANESVKYKITDPELGMQRSHDSVWAFAYSAQIGAQFHFSKCMYAYAAYEFRGNMAEPVLINQASVDTRAQTHHVFHLGVGFKF